MLLSQKKVKLGKAILAITLFYLSLPHLSHSACSARGSGTRAGQPLDLYYPAQDECPGGLTNSSTDSYRVNFDILRSTINANQLNGGNTNYASASGDSDYIHNAATQPGVAQSYQMRIQLATDTAKPTEKKGTIFYDETEETLAFYNDCAGVTVNLGAEMPIRVMNRSGATLANGAVIRISGFDANEEIPQVSSAIATSASNARVFGVMTTTTTNNSLGCATIIGDVHDLNTSAFSAGQVLYLSSSQSGGISGTAPTSFAVSIGYAGRISATTGTVHVEIGVTSSIDAILNQNTLQAGSTFSVLLASAVAVSAGSTTVYGQVRLALNQTDNVCIGKNQGGECSAGTNKLEVYAQAVNTDPLVVFNSSGNTSMAHSIDVNNNASLDLRRGGDEITVVIQSTGATSFSGGDVNVDEGSIGIGVNSTTGSFTIGGLKSIAGYRNYTGLADTHESLIVYPYINTVDASLRVFDIVASGSKNSSSGGSKLRLFTNPSTAAQGTPVMAMEISSDSVVNFTSAPYNTGACPSGFTRIGVSECWDTDGVPDLVIVSSAVTNGSGLGYTTYDIPTLNSTKAKAIQMEIHCDVANDAGAGDSFIVPDIRRTGGGGAGPGAAATRRPGFCNQSVALANNYCNGIAESRVGDTKDIDIAVEAVGGASGTCVFYLMKFSE